MSCPRRGKKTCPLVQKLWVQGPPGSFCTYSGSIPDLFQTCSGLVPDVFRAYSEPVPELFRTCSAPIPSLARICSRCIPDLFWTCSGPIPNMFPTYFGPIADLFWTYSGPFRTCSGPSPNLLRIYSGPAPNLFRTCSGPFQSFRTLQAKWNRWHSRTFPGIHSRKSLTPDLHKIDDIPLTLPDMAWHIPHRWHDWHDIHDMTLFLAAIGKHGQFCNDRPSDKKTPFYSKQTIAKNSGQRYAKVYHNWTRIWYGQILEGFGQVNFWACGQHCRWCQYTS